MFQIGDMVQLEVPSFATLVGFVVEDYGFDDGDIVIQWINHPIEHEKQQPTVYDKMGRHYKKMKKC
jgi:hypothetical protein